VLARSFKDCPAVGETPDAVNHHHIIGREFTRCFLPVFSLYSRIVNDCHLRNAIRFCLKDVDDSFGFDIKPFDFSSRLTGARKKEQRQQNHDSARCDKMF
jgi:hypothetical protein